MYKWYQPCTVSNRFQKCSIILFYLNVFIIQQSLLNIAKIYIQCLYFQMYTHRISFEPPIAWCSYLCTWCSWENAVHTTSFSLNNSIISPELLQKGSIFKSDHCIFFQLSSWFDWLTSLCIFFQQRSLEWSGVTQMIVVQRNAYCFLCNCCSGCIQVFLQLFSNDYWL